MGEVFLRVLRSSTLTVIPLLLLTHLQINNTLDQKDNLAKHGNVPTTQCSVKILRNGGKQSLVTLFQL